jgi:acyl homoserine lactone synthase
VVLPKSSAELRRTIGLVFDAFDRDDTLNLVFQRSGQILGMARLLPTTGPYALDSLWRELAIPLPAPNSSEIWELSRVQTADEQMGPGSPHGDIALALLQGLEQTARSLGIKRLVVQASVSLERLFERAGLHAHRAGASLIREGQPVCVCWIEVRERTGA